MLVALAGLALLWQHRPPAPALPRSLSAPLTVETIESVGLWLLWSVFGLLALALLLAPLRTRAGSTSWRLSRGLHDDPGVPREKLTCVAVGSGGDAV